MLDFYSAAAALKGAAKSEVALLRASVSSTGSRCCFHSNTGAWEAGILVNLSSKGLLEHNCCCCLVLDDCSLLEMTSRGDQLIIT